MSKLILTDVDDTVLNYLDPFQKWMAQQGYKTDQRIRDGHKTLEVYGITNEILMDNVRAFNASPQLHAQPAEECAQTVLPRLYDRGFRFVAISACGKDGRLRELRRKALQEAFGFVWEAVHTVGLDEGKLDHLHAYRPSIWVEDNFDHAVAGAEYGHRTFLINRPINSDRGDHPLVTRVDTWEEIEQYIVTEGL